MSASSLSFGSIDVGNSAVLNVTLTSTGTAPVTVNAPAISGAGFSVTGGSFPATLNPNQSVTFNVQFAPLATGNATGSVTINNSSGNNPVISLAGTGSAPAVATLSISSSSLSFGSVTTGTSANQVVTLTSTGTAPVTVNAPVISGTGFSVTSGSFPATLNPNQSMTFNVQFAPLATGNATGSVTINNSSGNNPVISLAGTGSAPAVATLSISSSSLSFGSVTTGTSATQAVALTSTGTAPVTVNAPAINGTGFSVTGGTFPATLNPNQSMTLTVSFAPATAGNATGNLTISSNSSVSPTSVISLSGNGAIPLTSLLTVSPASLPFGAIAIGNSSTLQVTITSTGTGPLTITSVVASGAGFTISGGPYPVTLNPNQTLTLSAQFAPTATGAESGAVTINNTSTNSPTASVALSGNGTTPTVATLAVAPTTLNFGTVTLGSSGSQTITLTSTGTAAVTVNSATIAGATFSVSGATFPVTLNPNQAVPLTLQFTPITTSAVTGTLTIASTDSTGNPAVVNLSGTGGAVAHEVDLSWLAPVSSVDPVAGYNIYRVAGTSTSYQQLNGSLNVGLTYVDTNVQSGLTYTYIVKSADAQGLESVASSSVTVTIP